MTDAVRRKSNTKNIIGPSGVREILFELAKAGRTKTPTVCIGGVNHSNVQHVLRHSAASRKELDGVAVVSAVMASPQPEVAARDLAALIESLPTFQLGPAEGGEAAETGWEIEELAPIFVEGVHRITPISHNMTN